MGRLDGVGVGEPHGLARDVQLERYVSLGSASDPLPGNPVKLFIRQMIMQSHGRSLGEMSWMVVRLTLYSAASSWVETPSIFLCAISSRSALVNLGLAQRPE